MRPGGLQCAGVTVHHIQWRASNGDVDCKRDSKAFTPYDIVDVPELTVWGERIGANTHMGGVLRKSDSNSSGLLQLVRT